LSSDNTRLRSVDFASAAANRQLLSDDDDQEGMMIDLEDAVAFDEGLAS
jgi:hypothetical protein